MSSRVAPLPPITESPFVMRKPRFSPTFSRVTLPTTTMRPPILSARSADGNVGAPTASRAMSTGALVVDDDLGGAEVTHEIHVARVANHRDDLPPETRGDLNARGADPTIRSIHEHPFARAQVPERHEIAICGAECAVEDGRLYRGNRLGNAVERRWGCDEVARVAAVGEDAQHPRRRLAERLLTGETRRALAARIAVHRGYAIAHGEFANGAPHFDDMPNRFVPGSDGEANEREAPFAIEKIAVADAARLDRDSDVPCFERSWLARRLVLEWSLPSNADEAYALGHLEGGKNACIFCASITLPETFNRPFMNAIVPDSLPLTIFTYSSAFILMVVLGAGATPSSTFIVPSSMVTW
jgi:hypothetical protein